MSERARFFSAYVLRAGEVATLGMSFARENGFPMPAGRAPFGGVALDAPHEKWRSCRIS